MKKIVMMVASMAVMLSLVLFNGTPAQAATQYETPNECFTYRDIATCVYVDWKRQDDGNGITIEGVGWFTNQGCDSLESSGGKYAPAYSWTINPDTMAYKNTWDFGADSCNGYHDLHAQQRENGGMYFQWNVKARIDQAVDQWLNVRWFLGETGNSDLKFRQRTDA